MKTQYALFKDTTAAAAALVMAAVLGAMPANGAERASRAENTGVASGLVIGAAAGGPLGAVLGAATGAWLGDRHHRQKAKIGSLEGTVALTRQEAERLGIEVSKLNDSLSAVEQSAGKIQGVVHFRTGETAVRPEDAERVAELGAWLGSYDRMLVRVAGYADPRGPQELNASLAAERAESVGRLLLMAGVDPARIVIEGRGGAAPGTLDPTLDNFAFERRVEISLEPLTEAVARLE